jgi:type VI secretion system protein ImpH
MPVRVLTFVGHWLRLPEHSVCRLGEQPETGTLGRSAIIGSRVWDCQLKFRVRIGPVGLAQVQRLLPGGKTFVRLQTWVRTYSGDGYFWDVQVVLKNEEVPAVQLGQAGLLGWTAWVKSRPSEKDAEDLILQPNLG